MAASLSSVLGFSSPVKYQYATSSSVIALTPKAVQFTSPHIMFVSRRAIKKNPWSTCLSVANRDQLASETNDKSSTSPKTSPSVEDGSGVKNEAGPQITEAPNGSPRSQSPAKRSSLTARERLRAARVRNRSTDTKAPKPEMGSKVLAALRGSDGGKMRSGLPEAPSNMLDDSKRGMPKQGLTFDFPGGADLFFIVLSFVLITTLMLATTFVVWKVGAIHFNEL